MERSRPRQASNYPVVRRPRVLPPGVVDVRREVQPVGLDVICNSCGHHLPKSRRLVASFHNYAPDGPQGSPLMRCYIRCPNCLNEFELGRNIGDADNFVAIAGATEYLAASDSVPGREINFDEEAYGDRVPRYIHERVHRIILDPYLRRKYYSQVLNCWPPSSARH